MLATLAVAALLQASPPPASQAQDTVPERTRTVTITARGNNSGSRDLRRKRTLTPALLASAYRDPAAREVIARARRARTAQDSTLRGYDAMARQRISAGISLRDGGRQRTVYRGEVAGRVRWQSGVGARVDVTGSRSTLPMVRRGVFADLTASPPIPYFPGREPLFNLAGMQHIGEQEWWLVHPLEDGAEAAYRYASGGTSSIAIPGGERVQLVEVRVEARRPDPDLIVGSLWFDAASGQLVRAAYRPAVPLDIWATAKSEMEADGDEEEDIRAVNMVNAMLGDANVTFDGFFVEYGLHRGRWWLPRAQRTTISVKVGPMRMPGEVEQSFDYASVNGDPLPVDSIVSPAIAQRIAEQAAEEADTLAADSAARRLRREARREARRAEEERAEREGRPVGCGGDTVQRAWGEDRYEGSLRVAVHMPCDTMALIQSADLPETIYDDPDDLFDEAAARDLGSSLGLNLQPGWGLGKPKLRYGLTDGYLRYNRVEGVSPAVSVRQPFGRGLTGMALVRMGAADRIVNGELSVERAAGTRAVGIGGYRRLAAANDWGDPLGFGSSLSALLFGRDEGFYYRTLGAEVTGRSREWLRWRLFYERQESAERETDFSVYNLFGDHDFDPNIIASEGNVAGASLRMQRTFFGGRPGGFRVLADTRLEGGTGSWDYGRGMLDLTFSRGLGARLDGALTVSAGTSAGDLQPQRLWYLGGAQTVRGQDAGEQLGNSYWLARAELGSSFVAARPVVFFDAGWAGDRSQFGVNEPLLGAGAGVSFLDGLVRLDVSKGLDPVRGVRADLYVEARF